MSGCTTVTGAIREQWFMELTSGSAALGAPATAHAFSLLVGEKTHWPSLVHIKSSQRECTPLPKCGHRDEPRCTSCFDPAFWVMI